MTDGYIPVCWCCLDEDYENSEVTQWAHFRSGHSVFLCESHFAQHTADACHIALVDSVETGVQSVLAHRGLAA